MPGGYQVQTDHQIHAYGQHMMRLVDSGTGAIIVTAQFATGTWTIHSTNIADATVTTGRADAITAMIAHALASLGGTGYSTLVPHGLPQMQ